MADTRIKVAKDKAEFLKTLRATEDTPRPFQSYADALVFAAALGMKRGVRKPIAEYSKSIDPIRQDIFYSKGYDQVINLLAITSSNNPKILASTEQAEEDRIRIFEEYANAGLEVLARALKGVVNDYYTEALLTFLNEECKTEEPQQPEDFDLTRFIS